MQLRVTLQNILQQKLWVSAVWGGRSLHHSGVDGNVIAGAERQNFHSIFPLFANQAGIRSDRPPHATPAPLSNCELILPLTEYYQPAAYCYRCHFSVVSCGSKSAGWDSGQNRNLLKVRRHWASRPHRETLIHGFHRESFLAWRRENIHI